MNVHRLRRAAEISSEEAQASLNALSLNIDLYGDRFF